MKYDKIYKTIGSDDDIQATLKELRGIIMDCPNCGVALRMIDYVSVADYGWFNKTISKEKPICCECPKCNCIIFKQNDHFDILRPINGNKGV